MLATGTSVGLDEPRERLRFAAGVSPSPIVKLSAPVELSSSMLWSDRLERVGGVFTWLTVSTKVSLALFTPSLTVMVIVAVPVWPEAGVTVTLRLAPLPPNTMLLVGTNMRFDELAVRVRLPTGVSASLIVNGKAAVAVFTVVDWSGISLIVGGDPLDEAVATVKLHPPAIVPWSPGPSSNTYRDQLPLGDWPLNTDKAVV